jgi:predicted metal-dependent hydrolase
VPEQWQACGEYLFGIDLFNNGYYWEAHEAWEALWNATGRRGAAADFLKALIQLAVTGVKIREGKLGAAARHSRRACDLLQRAFGECENIGRFMGLEVRELIQFAQTAAREAGAPRRDLTAAVESVFDSCLVPVESKHRGRR